MKKRYIITKTIWQIFLVFVEVVGVTSVLVFSSRYLRSFQDSFDIVERYVLFFAAYEIIVYVILNFINDARQDALLALKSGYELALLYFETQADLVKDGVYKTIETQLSSKGVFNHLDILEKYKQLKLFVDNGEVDAIKTQLLFIQHDYEMTGLQWKFTFLLRLFNSLSARQ
ncbi:MAG TPA: hypothetical protein VLA72_11960 [Anaerolineales bacterium]|nr:hypothetical protein [Anaerolineales bacterium]